MVEDTLSCVEVQSTFTLKTQTHSELADLLSQLLACVGEKLTPSSLPQENEAKSEVVLDIQFEDIRYTLMRSFNPEISNHPVNLSPREQEIVRLVAKGHSNKVIAKVLDISPWTVSTHLRRVFVKLEVSSRAEMVARVLEADLHFISD